MKRQLWQMGSLPCVVVMSVLVLSGCGAAYHRTQVQDDGAKALTVGTVQREIRVGMSSAEVVVVLGSPNIVTTDEQRREVWVYDKMSTNTAYSKSEGGVFLLIIGASAEGGARSTTQKTLTIIVKFDEQAKVRDFAYHASKF